MAIALPSTPRHESPQDQVFDRLVVELLGGRYPVGARLPSERDLALQHRTSRSTLREALRRIEGLGLVRARRGSGLVVRDLLRDGSIDLLPLWVRAGMPGAAPGVVLRYLLRLRRILLSESLRMAARAGDRQALGTARARLAEAWALRGDREAFVRADFELTHALSRATGFPPAAWLLNTLEKVYLELAGALVDRPATPRDYLKVHTRILDALEAGQGEKAAALIDAYFERHDTRLLRALGLR